QHRGAMMLDVRATSPVAASVGSTEHYRRLHQTASTGREPALIVSAVTLSESRERLTPCGPAKSFNLPAPDVPPRPRDIRGGAGHSRADDPYFSIHQPSCSA